MLPWLHPERVPLYLAPMAGITDYVFRKLCKELGADVMVTEFVSAEGIVRQDDRTRKYTEFDDAQRPLGVQIFGAAPVAMAEATRKIIAWKEPDFIDINFGCPVNKVVSKNGGSSLLRDCPALAAVAQAIVKAAAPVPVTAKMRIGWDENTINAREVVHILEESGIAAVAIHGRTRAQGYTGLANWDVIADCAAHARIPVIGNGDLSNGRHIEQRMKETKVRGLMIGRAAMTSPWIFRDARHWLATGTQPAPVPAAERWAFILRHCRMALEHGRYGEEKFTVQAMRSRLMAYSRGLPAGRALRGRFSQVRSVMELEDLAAEYLNHPRTRDETIEPPEVQ